MMFPTINEIHDALKADEFHRLNTACLWVEQRVVAEPDVDSVWSVDFWESDVAMAKLG